MRLTDGISMEYPAPIKRIIREYPSTYPKYKPGWQMYKGQCFLSHPEEFIYRFLKASIGKHTVVTGNLYIPNLGTPNMKPVDLCLPEIKVAIELDGSKCPLTKKVMAIKSEHLLKRGYSLIRVRHWSNGLFTSYHLEALLSLAYNLTLSRGVIRKGDLEPWEKSLLDFTEVISRPSIYRVRDKKYARNKVGDYSS